MLAATRSAAVLGIDAFDVTVEVDVAPGLPRWTIVGLAASAVQESRERVSAALANTGFAVPPKRVTVSLAPGDRKKDGTGFDLAVAVALLAALGEIDAERVARLVFLGELGLDGTLRPVRGVLPIARHASRADGLTLVVPPNNAPEAAVVEGLRVVAPATLEATIAWLRDGVAPSPPAMPPRSAEPRDLADFAEVAGQHGAKRALEIAAAGAHAVLLAGPPGAGKTMLARRIPGILPRMSEEEALEVTAVQSVAGLLPDGMALVSARPFRAPHHTISSAGLIGGGSSPRPGEVSLAHHGVLFLDELLEFPRYVLDVLRQPLEDGRVVIARAAASVTFPARFTLVAAMNPCPCGHAGVPGRECHCSAADVLRYRARLSGPLADRIDMHVALGPVPRQEMTSAQPGEASAAIRERVEHARERQARRYAALRLPVRVNGHASGRWIERHGALQPEARTLAHDAADRLLLSARAYHRVLKVARTIADLDGCEMVSASHVSEALRYRPAADSLAEVARAGEPSSSLRSGWVPVLRSVAIRPEPPSRADGRARGHRGASPSGRAGNGEGRGCGSSSPRPWLHPGRVECHGTDAGRLVRPDRPPCRRLAGSAGGHRRPPRGRGPARGRLSRGPGPRPRVAHCPRGTNRRQAGRGDAAPRRSRVRGLMGRGGTDSGRQQGCHLRRRQRQASVVRRRHVAAQRPRRAAAQ